MLLHVNGYSIPTISGADYHYEAILIHNRPANPATPYYTGAYVIGVTDNLDSGTNYLDGENVSRFIWRDGLIKQRVNKGTTICGVSKHYWYPVQITSAASGSGPTSYVLKTPTSTIPSCGDLGDAPY